MTETLVANSTISHYRILSKIGAGGMGEVYLAQDTKLDPNFALAYVGISQSYSLMPSYSY